MHCHALGIDTLDIHLPGDKIEEAKFKAISICVKKATALLSDLNKINH